MKTEKLFKQIKEFANELGFDIHKNDNQAEVSYQILDGSTGNILETIEPVKNEKETLVKTLESLGSYWENVDKWQFGYSLGDKDDAKLIQWIGDDVEQALTLFSTKISHGENINIFVCPF